EPPKTKQAESTMAKENKTDSSVKQEETKQPDKKAEETPKQEIVIIQPKEKQASESEQPKPVQEPQKKNQSKTEKNQQSGQKQQTQSSQKNVIQQQEKIASVTVNPQPQIQEIPKKLFDIPQAKPGTKICFVIDDAGLHASNVKRYTSLPFPITIAVLPKLAQSSECAQVVRSAGKELILHQPMQAHNYSSGTTPNPGPGAILPDMTSYEVAQTVKSNLDSLGGGVKGMNNHEGSLITENYIKMNTVLEVAVERGIYFLDSRTTSSSAVPQVALERDLRYLARFAPFLDNEINRASMLEMIYKGLDVANKNGYAVMIGHVDKSVNVLPQLLSDIYPYLVQAGYTLTVPSRL
ncbi:MAG: divergent polysaccharide deacetylase family protein, partial [Treponema sp.]|nr:divergent polysaccharide deacetylase family protein [Treponema sp.]